MPIQDFIRIKVQPWPTVPPLFAVLWTAAYIQEGSFLVVQKFFAGWHADWSFLKKNTKNVWYNNYDFFKDIEISVNKCLSKNYTNCKYEN